MESKCRDRRGEGQDCLDIPPGERQGGQGRAAVGTEQPAGDRTPLEKEVINCFKSC